MISAAPKRCYDPRLGRHGKAGEWTFKVYIDGIFVATEAIEVADRLETESFYAHSSIPYVLGRLNYDAEIPASDSSVVWSGVWMSTRMEP